MKRKTMDNYPRYFHFNKQHVNLLLGEHYPEERSINRLPMKITSHFLHSFPHPWLRLTENALMDENMIISLKELL